MEEYTVESIKDEIRQEYRNIMGNYNPLDQREDCSSYFVVVDEGLKKVEILLKNNRALYGGLAFDTLQKAEQFIENVGEDILLQYWFRVKE